MPDIVDFLEKQREHQAKLREQAKAAAQKAEEARQRFNAWEHGEDAEKVGLAYPWDERPWELPLERSEIGIALKLAKLNTRLAARLLRVSLERLEVALEGTEWKSLIRKRRSDPEQASPVSATRHGNQLVIKVKKPPGESEISIGFDEQNNLIVVVTPKPGARFLELVERAEEVMKESKQ